MPQKQFFSCAFFKDIKEVLFYIKIKINKIIKKRIKQDLLFLPVSRLSLSSSLFLSLFLSLTITCIMTLKSRNKKRKSLLGSLSLSRSCSLSLPLFVSLTILCITNRNQGNRKEKKHGVFCLCFCISLSSNKNRSEAIKKGVQAKKRPWATLLALSRFFLSLPFNIYMVFYLYIQLLQNITSSC